jgi:4-amino-4-deoxy-L-arabinose transferase-like glycosyltransferase
MQQPSGACWITAPIKHFTTPVAGHFGPVYFYLVVFLVEFMPWSGFLPFAALCCSYLDSSRQRVRFLLLLLIFSIVILSYFTFSATKLPNYIGPALPGLAMITATLFDEQEKDKIPKEDEN